MAGYTCKAVGCYGVSSPETHVLFMTLQSEVNRFVAGLKLLPIKVDGIIGKGTTQTTLEVLSALGASGWWSGTKARDLEAAINSPSDLASRAGAVIEVLRLAASNSPLAAMAQPVPPLPPTQPGPTATQIATTSANKPAQSSDPGVQQSLDAKRKQKPGLQASLIDYVPPWAAYAGGGALLLGAIGMLVMQRRKGGAASSPAAAVVQGIGRLLRL